MLPSSEVIHSSLVPIQVLGVNALMTETYIQMVLNMFPAPQIAGYWPGNENSGSNANDASKQNNDGTYIGAIVLADKAAPPCIRGKAPKFTGGYVNIFSPGFAADFSGDTGTVMIWAQVDDITIWIDGLLHRMFLVEDAAANDRISIYKPINDATVVFEYESGGVVNQVAVGGVYASAWCHFVLTWDKPNDEVKAYFNGLQVGVTQNGLGVWGDPLALALVGAGSLVPVETWDGWLCHTLVLNVVANPTQILRLYCHQLATQGWLLDTLSSDLADSDGSNILDNSVWLP